LGILLPAVLMVSLVQIEPARAQSDAATDDRSENLTVILLDPEGSPLARRLQQELEALGFTVQRRSASSPALAEELRPPRVVAAIEVLPARSGQIDLVAVSPRGSDLIRQSLPIEAQEDPASAELVATRTIELLRALRLELEAARQRAKPVAERRASAPIRVEPAAPPEGDTRGAVLAGGPSLSAAPPFGIGVSGWVGLAWRAAPHASVMGEISLPLAAGSLERTEGEVGVLTNAYRVGASLETSREARLAAAVSAGAQLEFSWFRGFAREPYVGEDSRQWTFGPWVRAGGAVRLSTRMRAVVTGTAGLSLPTTTVRLAGREVARFGSPSLNAGIGLEWAL
jgi:hypothetical protein